MCQQPPVPHQRYDAVFRLRAEPGSAGSARRFVRCVLAELLLEGGEAAEDAALVVTELVANAVRHTASRHVVCRLAAPGDEIRVSVEDEGGTLGVPRSREASDDAECGRGLLLVEALASAWGVVAREPEGRVVWAVLKAGE